MSRIKIEASRVVCWDLRGRSSDQSPGLAPALGPGGYMEVARKRIAAGHMRWACSEMRGATSAGSSYRFDEFVASMTDLARQPLVADAAEAIAWYEAQGGEFIDYMGKPYTPYDLGLWGSFESVMMQGRRTKIVFDASAVEMPGSICERIMASAGGKSRFILEAMPLAYMEHWLGWDVIMLDHVYRRVLEFPHEYLPLDKMGEVIVCFTNHDREHRETEDIRLAIEAADAGRTIGWMPHRDERWRRAFEVVGGQL